MAAPANRPIEVYMGDDYSHVVTLTSDGTTPINITGRTYAAKIRASRDSTTVLLTFTCSVLVGTDGKVTITSTDTLTAALQPGVYVWDLEETSGTTVTTILAGDAVVTQDVTR